MTRDAFLAKLRAGLRGLPAPEVQDILADYASHFDEGAAAGRGQEAIAAALGDPGRLARELRAQAGLKRWDEERSAPAALAAIVAILSLGAIDILLLAPVLLVVLAVMLCLCCVALVLVVGGAAVLGTAPFGLGAGLIGSLPGSLAGTLLRGLGLAAFGVSLGALQIVLAIVLTDLLTRYGRFHLRLLKPTEP